MRSLRSVVLPAATWNPATESRNAIRYVDVSAVSRETLAIDPPIAIAAKDAPSRARKIVRQDDTIFATIRPTLKRVAKVPAELDDEIVSTAFCVLRPDTAKVDADYLFFLASSDAFVASVAEHETGASYPAVRDRDVLDQEIEIPALEEQRQIARTLGALRAATLNEIDLLRAAKELKLAAMRELFTRGLRGEAQKETEFGPAPESWSEVALDHCATVQTGAAKGRRFSDAETTDVPYLRVANVQDGHLDLSEMKEIRIRKSEIERYRLLPGDVVLTEGGDFDKLGRGFIWQGELPLCVHQNHVFAVRPNPERLIPQFFAYLAQSFYGKAYFLKVAHKTTNLACINSTKLKAFPALVPPTLDEQREIVTILDALDRKIDLHRQKRTVLEELFQSLLHKLMTGEIRVADLDLSALPPAQAQEVTG